MKKQIKESKKDVKKDVKEEDVLAARYQMMSEIEHVLERPSVYIGSIQKQQTELWTSPAAGSLEQREINYIPGLYKLFDEAIVNCRDHLVRMDLEIEGDLQDQKEDPLMKVSYIHVEIDPISGQIALINDGRGLDVEKHPATGLWIPEMIFAHLRTSTNYSDAKDGAAGRLVGGQNGLGIKLVIIWSSQSYIETVDHVRGLRYSQHFGPNLSIREEPVIEKVTKKPIKPYTRICFTPDYNRLGLSLNNEGEKLDADMIALLRRRTADMAALSNRKIDVRFNGDKLGIKNFEAYARMFTGEKVVHESPHPRWEYAVSLSNSGEFQQVSFVNGIATHKGGNHVDYLVGKITQAVGAYIEEKKKIKVSPASIKEQLFVVLKCDIEEPTFDSQSKDYLTSTVAKFGSKFSLGEKFAEKIAKLGVMDVACSISKAKEEKNIAKTTDGRRGTRILTIPKYTSANLAGSKHSGKCTLILCEGDSAKSGVLSGLSNKDRDVFGIYPLRGKLLNVRGEEAAKKAANKEITELKQILGLQNGIEYASMEEVVKKLNYGRVMILCDADVDGSHIKGLVINFFECEWPSLISLPGFLCYMNTPILKASKGTKKLVFYNNGEYDRWKTETPNHSNWSIKYYKGLGTSTAADWKEYFAAKKVVNYVCEDTCSEQIDMAFNKERADDRKHWLNTKYDANSYVDTSKPQVSYSEFVDKDLIHFSTYNCARAIPHLMDGFKTSQRKILFCAFKRNMTSEIKVAQFSGYVSENSCYHHGEQSLCAAIVGMAQDYMGSNNVNLLLPNGQFGTRLGQDGVIGDDSASPRYICTQLNSITRFIFRKQDELVLKYLEDDGTAIEPEYFAPILPMVLVNGSQGIGTGYSSTVPPFDPLLLLSHIEETLKSGEIEEKEWTPYYEGFKGSIEALDIQGTPNRWLLRGVYTKMPGKQDTTIKVTELPPGMATSKLLEILRTLIEPPPPTGKGRDKKTAKSLVRDYRDNSTNLLVNVEIDFAEGVLAELEAENKAGINGIERVLKLTSTVGITNMYMFSPSGRLTQYKTVQDIIRRFCGKRLSLYAERKRIVLQELQREKVILENKARYIEETLQGIVDLKRKSKEQIFELLSQRSYDMDEKTKDYEYLCKMRMDSVSTESVSRLEAERNTAVKAWEELNAKTPEQIWLEELAELRVELLKYRNSRSR